MTVCQYRTQVENGMLVRVTGRPTLRNKGFFSFVIAKQKKVCQNLALNYMSAYTQKKPVKQKDLQAEALKNLYRVATVCRMCKNRNLFTYLDLGFTPHADQFRTSDELDIPEIFYPLRVLMCENCGLSQLSHIVSPKVLYQFDYPYEQSMTRTGQAHWDSFAEYVVDNLKLKKNPKQKN